MTSTPRTLTVPATRAIVAALALAVASSLAVVPAGAGIRDLVKSAKDKAAQKAGQKPAAAAGAPGAVPVFDDRVLELTDARVAQVLKGLKAGAAFTADLPGLVGRQNALNQELQKLNDTHGAAISEYEQKRDAQRECFGETLRESRDQRHQALIEQRQSDPALLKKLAELSVRYNEAQVKGDTAAVRRIAAEMAGATDYTPADSLAAKKKCGAPPPPLPAAARRDAAQSERAGVDERIRAMNAQVRKVQLDASGLSEDQMAIAVDRITLYLAAVKRNQTPQGFSPPEMQALAANKDALSAALGA